MLFAIFLLRCFKFKKVKISVFEWCWSNIEVAEGDTSVFGWFGSAPSDSYAEKRLLGVHCYWLKYLL